MRDGRTADGTWKRIDLNGRESAITVAGQLDTAELKSTWKAALLSVNVPGAYLIGRCYRNDLTPLFYSKPIKLTHSEGWVVMMVGPEQVTFYIHPLGDQAFTFRLIAVHDQKDPRINHVRHYGP